MLRNIRRFYWKQRDRGQGRKTVMAVLVFFLFVAIIVAAIIKSMMGGHGTGLETVHKPMRQPVQRSLQKQHRGHL